ncbi:hypothetical protein HY440_00040 [Candidatus Microgenomates bacterium]|nr:hypothetical protein [Candidatus Microgenomates bacterium]
MSPEVLANIFQFHLLFKLFFLVVVLFYFVLTVVIYRQVTLLSQTLNSSISPLIRQIAFVQIVVVGVFFFLGLVLV